MSPLPQTLALEVPLAHNLLDAIEGALIDILYWRKTYEDGRLKTKKIVSGLFGRHEDFSQGTLDECYVVHNSKAVVVKSDAYTAPDKESIKQLINDVIEKLRT